MRGWAPSWGRGARSSGGPLDAVADVRFTRFLVAITAARRQWLAADRTEIPLVDWGPLRTGDMSRSLWVHEGPHPVVSCARGAGNSIPEVCSRGAGLMGRELSRMLIQHQI